MLNSKSGKLLLPIGLVILLSLLAGSNMLEYMHFTFEVKLVLIISPFAIFVSKKDFQSARFAVFSLIFLVAFIFLKIQCCYFFAFAFLLLYIIETHFGKLNDNAIFLVVLLSPLSIYFFKVFGFPIRLELTRFAAHALTLFYKDVHAFGNLIVINGKSFSVDPACMGLKMMNSGLAIELFFIAFFTKKFKTSSTLSYTLLLLSIAFILLVLSNLFRIILLVVFGFPPETAGHEIIGLMCFVVYFIIPVYFINKALLNKRKDDEKPTQLRILKPIYKYSVFGILLIALTFLNIKQHDFKNYGNDKQTEYLCLEGYAKTCNKTNIFQFKKENALVYVKASCNFYGADHNPLICWEGSGYEFNNVSILQIDREEIYYTKLSHPNGDELFTAWWFDNGEDKTISQLDWRWNMIRGAEAYRLVNVTTESLSELKSESKKLLEKNLFEK